MPLHGAAGTVDGAPFLSFTLRHSISVGGKTKKWFAPTAVRSVFKQTQLLRTGAAIPGGDGGDAASCYGPRATLRWTLALAGEASAIQQVRAKGHTTGQGPYTGPRAIRKYASRNLAWAYAFCVSLLNCEYDCPVLRDRVVSIGRDPRGSAEQDMSAYSA